MPAKCYKGKNKNSSKEIWLGQKAYRKGKDMGYEFLFKNSYYIHARI
jgi:hypothetical protein